MSTSQRRLLSRTEAVRELVRTAACLNASLERHFAEKSPGHGSPAGLGDDRDGNHHIGVAVVDDGHLVQQGSHWGVGRDGQEAFRRETNCNWGSDLVGQSIRSLHWHFLHGCVETKERGTSDEPGGER